MAQGPVEWDMAAVRLALEHSAELRDHLEQLGREGIDFAKSIAPDRTPLGAGYIDSFVASVGHDRYGLPVLAIANTDYKTWWIENGTAPHSTSATGAGGVAVSMPAHHVLDKTLDQLRR